MSRLVRLCLCLLILAATAAAQNKSDDFLTGPPFTLDDLLKRIGIIADKRLGTAVERRGVIFSPTPADLDRLKRAGAGAELIRVILKKAPPPAQPPAPAREARILVRCTPAECDVTVNGKPRGSTSNGAIELADLPAGENVIDFRKEGFEGQQLALTLTAGATATHTITLRPTAAMRARLGKQLFDAMVAKLGGTAALRGARLISASGTAALFPANGERLNWQLAARLKLPGMAMLEITRGKFKWWTSLKGDDSKAGGTKQMSTGPIAKELEKLVRIYRDYQPAALVEEWQAMTVGAPSAEAANGQLRFRVAGKDGAFMVSLDPDHTPRRVAWEPSSGSGGIEVLYSDFAAIGKVLYPKSMAVRLAGEPQRDLELHFQQVDFPDKIADKEFHR